MVIVNTDPAQNTSMPLGAPISVGLLSILITSLDMVSLFDSFSVKCGCHLAHFWSNVAPGDAERERDGLLAGCSGGAGGLWTVGRARARFLAAH